MKKYEMKYKKKGMKTDKGRFRKAAVILFWVALWAGLCLTVDNSVLMASPLKTAEKLAEFLKTGEFYHAVGLSLLRIGAGFLAGFTAAVILAAGSSRFFLLEELLSPVMGAAKSVPVASFAVVVLIWWGSDVLAVAVCFLVVLPNLYISTIEGFRSSDRKLLEMAQVFRLPAESRFLYIYRPALKPFLYSGMKVSLGMCWKSGVAAELIGIPMHSIGEQIYLSKLYLDTAGVFAWTAVVMSLAFLFEKLILCLTEQFFSWEPSIRKQRTCPRDGGERRLVARAVAKSVDITVKSGEVVWLTWPSGSGKTTLLHILAGLLEPEEGTCETPEGCSMVFQEDRLCEDYSGSKNVELITGDLRRAKEALAFLGLNEDEILRPCSSLSGGMRRRVALARAMEADSACVFLDEPFTGMDEDTARLAGRYIRERQNGRILVIASHDSPPEIPCDISL